MYVELGIGKKTELEESSLESKTSLILTSNKLFLNGTMN